MVRVSRSTISQTATPESNTKISTLGGRSLPLKPNKKFNKKLFDKKIEPLVKGHDLTKKLNLFKSNITHIQAGLSAKDEPEHQKAIASLTQSIFNDILILSKKGTTEKDLRDVDDGLSLLCQIETSKEKRDVYTSLLLHTYNKHKDFRGVAKIYKNQILPHLAPNKNLNSLSATFETAETSPTQLKKWISSCQSTVPPLFKLNYKEQIPYEVEMIALLNGFLGPHKGKKANPIEASKIEAFLLYAYGNENLNKRIHEIKGSKRSDAEDFIDFYTYATLGSKRELSEGAIGASNIETKVNMFTSFVTNLSLYTAYNRLIDIEDIEKNLYACLKGLNQKKHTSISSKIKNFFKIYNQGDKTVWEIRRSQDTLNQAQDIIKSLNAPRNRNDSDLQEIKGYLETYIQNIEEANRIFDDFFNSNIEKKLDKDILQTILRSADISGDLDALVTACSEISLSPILGTLQKQCDASYEAKRNLNRLSDMTQSLKPGDIAFQEDLRYKKLYQSSKPAYSTLDPLHNPKDFKRLFTDISQGKIFDVQPYFTGDKKHSRMIFATTSNQVFKNTTVTNENGRKRTTSGDRIRYPEKINNDSGELITSTREAAQFDIMGNSGVRLDNSRLEESWAEVLYRPNFNAILTEEAKRQGISADEVRILYNLKLQKRIEGETSWNTYKFDRPGAAISYIMTKVPRIMSLKQFVRHLLQFLFGIGGLLHDIFTKSFKEATSKQNLDILFNKVQKRFCSELNAAVLREALNDTEIELKKLHPQVTSQILKTIIPPYLDPSEVHPNMLEELITKHGYFEKVGSGRPKLLTQLFNDE